jgi:hypothetical protein
MKPIAGISPGRTGERTDEVGIRAGTLLIFKI